MPFDFTPFVISIKTTLLATLITFVIGTLSAHYIAFSKIKCKGVIDGLFNLPLVLPPTVVGFVLLIIFGRYSFFGKLLYSIGINIIFSWSATVIAAVVVAFPLMYKTARGAFEQIDMNILNAARTLGVSEWKIFLKITLPLSWPGVLAGCILSFARALGEFGATLMIAGNIPGKTQTIPVAIYFAVAGGEMRQATIWVIIIIAISLLVIVLMNFWLDNQRKFMSQ
jgi:molybdate transport system permease protein